MRWESGWRKSESGRCQDAPNKPVYVTLVVRINGHINKMASLRRREVLFGSNAPCPPENSMSDFRHKSANGVAR